MAITDWATYLAGGPNPDQVHASRLDWLRGALSDNAADTSGVGKQSHWYNAQPISLENARESWSGLFGEDLPQEDWNAIVQDYANDFPIAASPRVSGGSQRSMPMQIDQPAPARPVVPRSDTNDNVSSGVTSIAGGSPSISSVGRDTIDVVDSPPLMRRGVKEIGMRGQMQPQGTQFGGGAAWDWLNSLFGVSG
jgi:hypothetical protein